MVLVVELRKLWRIEFLQPMEVYVDDEAKLTLHGLQQHYVKLAEKEKNKKLLELLDALEFNQVSSTKSPADRTENGSQLGVKKSRVIG